MKLAHLLATLLAALLILGSGTANAGQTINEAGAIVTGGTGKYENASGGGTYMYENLSDTIAGGTYKGQMVLP